jgi:WD40 repeat protein
MEKLPLDGGEKVSLGANLLSPQLDPTGRYLAARFGSSPTVVVMDLETERRWELDSPGEGNAFMAAFDTSGNLVITRGGVVSRWNPADETTETLFEEVDFGFPYPDGRMLVGEPDDTRWLVNLEDGSRVEFPIFGPGADYMWDPSGEIVASGCADGSLLAWTLADQNQHLFLGHGGLVSEPQVSPDGKWIAAPGEDGTVRLWPMHDLSKTPFHDLPHEELLAKLKSMTNLRVFADENSHTGVVIGPDFTAYRGWAEVPTW